jgi:hypothetical protein
MGNKPHIATNKPDSKHVHTPGAATQPKYSLTNQSTDAPTQGEHTQAPSNMQISHKEPSKLAHTADCLEHAHRPELPAAPPAAPENQSVPADTTMSCCTTRWQASASTQPYEHIILNSDHAGGKFHHDLWTQALDTLPNISNKSIRDPESVYRPNTTHSGIPQANYALPMHIEECFLNIHCNRDDEAPCVNTWIAHNHSAMAQPSNNDSYHISDESSPKWADTLTGPEKRRMAHHIGNQI